MRAEQSTKKAQNSWAPSKSGSSAVYFAGAPQHLPTASAWATTTSPWATTTGVEELTKEDGLRMTKCLLDMNENIKKLEKNLNEIHGMLACLTERHETLESQLKFVLPSAPVPPSASDGG